ncbi:MAG: DUF4197 domain-containing protein [Alphaproteobacteria bacterium]
MKKIALTVLVPCMLFVANDAQAQDWWDKAKNILNSELGKEAVQSVGGQASSLTNNDIVAGLKEALQIGTQHVTSQLGAQNGFNLDPQIHIPLPPVLARVDKVVSAVGMGSLTDDLELRLNRAAEAATPKAKELFIDAIQQMTIEDAKNILVGSDNDAATQYLRRTMGAGLEKEMQPIVENAMANAGAVQAYDSLKEQYSPLSFMPDVKASLNDYVVGKAMDGIFYYVAREEAEIRENPEKRTTDLLKKVFSSK